MKPKSKMLFYNFMIFMIIFDAIYLMVWIFSIQMNPVKAVIVAGLAIMLTPWARPANLRTGRKVVIKSLVFSLYNKYFKKQES